VSARQDTWDPTQYQRFAAERRQPFDDLLALVQPTPGGRVIDLGCGTGELTVELHQHTGATTTLGIDSSAAMLERAPRADGVSFELGDIQSLVPDRRYEVVFANAALQWVPNHERLLPAVASLVVDGGQLAVQVPANHDHPSHTTSVELANEEPYRTVIGDAAADPVAGNVLPPERYAEILHELGFVEQHVRLQVYGHELDATADVVEWTKGTSLTRFKNALPPELFDRFVDEYRKRLVNQLGDRRPFFYAFKRILCWARKP